MNIEQFYNLALQTAEELPDVEGKRFLAVLESLEEVGPTEWGLELSKISSEFLKKVFVIRRY